jgi:hypothetical protein
MARLKGKFSLSENPLLRLTGIHYNRKFLWAFWDFLHVKVFLDQKETFPSLRRLLRYCAQGADGNLLTCKHSFI